MTTTTPTIVLDLRTVQDHFPGIGRYTFHLAQALAETAPAWRFVMLTQPGAINTRFDVTGLARRPAPTTRQKKHGAPQHDIHGVGAQDSRQKSFQVPKEGKPQKKNNTQQQQLSQKRDGNTVHALKIRFVPNPV